MKKIISLALILLMIFSISLTVVSCGKDNNEPSGTNEGGENDGITKDDKDDGKQNTYPGDTPPVTLPSK